MIDGQWSVVSEKWDILNLPLTNDHFSFSNPMM
jgi:hypothetical protein